ncbi:hypothetical protein GCM10027429_02810 [Marivirga atlantica]|jgi:hypothetical protein|uniref:Lipoprotein n=1 Tax=Marivirga atlantica TaxID=1548457 RepID=A0A937DFP1_9BACT|nr:hypothetical protein [Marivirga atlantica]MBL0763893.1 hypothetical protein [Marivirga atlantica]
MSRFFLIILAAFMVYGCSNNLKEQPINTYYSVDSLLNAQLKLLTKSDINVEKKIAIDGEHELDTVSFDSLGWSNELAVFRIADINKPNLKGRYEATEESGEDQRIWHYVAKKESLGIEYLHVYFNANNQLEKLEAKYNEDNALYTSERNLTLAFNTDKQLIQSYVIEGSQKMIMKDPVNFSISSKLID